MFSVLDNKITYNEIRKACSQLSTGRADGPDHVINEFFKYGLNRISAYIETLFNKLYDMGYFPSQWTEGYIVLIFKWSDENLAENYLGITFLSTFVKLFTRVINNRFNKWAEDYFVYTEAQAGFRQKWGQLITYL